MPKMNGDRLKAHHDMKRRALEILEGLAGEDIQIAVLRSRLGITTHEEGQHLAQALESLRDDDHKATRGKRIGWWKSATPHQQPLPVGQAPAAAVDLLALTGLQPDTVEVLRERLAHARAKHPNKDFTALRWLTALMGEATEALDALSGGDAEADEGGIREWEGRIRDELLDVATVALRMHEEWAR